MLGGISAGPGFTCLVRGRSGTWNRVAVTAAAEGWVADCGPGAEPNLGDSSPALGRIERGRWISAAHARARPASAQARHLRIGGPGVILGRRTLRCHRVASRRKADAVAANRRARHRAIVPRAPRFRDILARPEPFAPAALLASTLEDTAMKTRHLQLCWRLQFSLSQPSRNRPRPLAAPHPPCRPRRYFLALPSRH